ncbi:MULTISPECIES: YuiB family protein [unclassified Paenibacillus]|uniref:YuiB family protein n=1 Tax=unclassified Paenibacillus TaxID=185978 RepID=UPI001C1260EC|nr:MULTISPECIES: YuiB family protein [unclassified Paenibacillus]MBU5441482.1 YuiB family protein [Paenibacillus sp. MSJ-34]CAH0118352.1 hypothetical protein PAE9249_00839 [Paenibacillus sp. CECT 9249]
MGFIPVFVLFVLFFVMMFGIGFILNMLMKTTWFPSYLFVIVILPIVFFSFWKEGSLLDNLAAYSVVDYLTAVGGLVGAWASGAAIRKLRRAGFKMF